VLGQQGVAGEVRAVAAGAQDHRAELGVLLARLGVLAPDAG
jgi:hypothetical protein